MLKEKKMLRRNKSIAIYCHLFLFVQDKFIISKVNICKFAYISIDN